MNKEKFIEKFIELDTVYDIAVKYGDKVIERYQAKQIGDLFEQIRNELPADEALEVLETIANI